MIKTPWKEIAEQLDSDYAKKYFYHQEYKTPRFWDILTVLKDFDKVKTFTTKVYNIFIISEPFGWYQKDGTWTFRWPPVRDLPVDQQAQADADYTAMITRHNSTYNSFPYYHTVIYMDYITAKAIKQARPDSDIIFMMNTTEGSIQSLCNQLSGWKYGGRIEDQVQKEYFLGHIEHLFGKQQ